MTARCRVPSRVGARVPCRVSTRVPGRVDAQLAPSSHPSRPHKPCRSQPLSTAGLWGSQQWGRVERKKGRDCGGGGMGASPGACFPRLPTTAFLPRAFAVFYPFYPSRLHVAEGFICAARLPCNLCCSPRWEKPELTREQPAEVRHLPSKPRADKTLPHC